MEQFKHSGLYSNAAKGRAITKMIYPEKLYKKILLCGESAVSWIKNKIWSFLRDVQSMLDELDLSNRSYEPLINGVFDFLKRLIQSILILRWI